MYALAINGSPRADGNTAVMLRKVLEPLAAAGWETELFQFAGKPIRGCTSCCQCFEKRDMKCVINDVLTKEILAKLFRADAIVIGSPTYFADVTSEVKALMDRVGFVAIANGNALAGKIGAAVAVARRGGAIHVFDTINHFFLINQMIVPGSTYWNMGYGMDPGEVGNDGEGMENMGHLGQVVDWLGKAIVPKLKGFPKNTGE